MSVRPDAVSRASPARLRVENIVAEWQQPGRAGVTQVAVAVVPAFGQTEQVLVAAQRRVVVVIPVVLTVPGTIRRLFNNTVPI
jgi:hypothetical protein